MSMENGDTCKFSKAEQDWDLERLFSDMEAKQLKKVTPAQQRNLKALLLGLSPKDVSPILNIEEKSLKPAFSFLYRLIEELLDQPERSVNHRNVPLVLSQYRKGTAIATDFKFDLLGRDGDRQKLEEFSQQHKIVLIKAGAGVGKSTLAREFLQTHFQKVIRLEMGLESGNVTPAEEKVSQILRRDFDEEPSRDFGINLDILREKLSDQTNPIAVLIDNLEPALDETYRFRENLRGYDALLAVLGDRDVCSFTLITSRRSLIVPRAKVYEYSLEGLDITAWRQYFHDCENVETSEPLLQMRDAYNGNAKVMDILQNAIINRFDGNIAAYWSQYKDALLADSELETLISIEIDWLRDNQPDAYKLLCRMGCYRYQDVKTVPFEGLICLLWDVSESRKACIVNYLGKTSLIEVKGEYYLHPAVRSAAKLRLQENRIDWVIVNHRIAEFWTRFVEKVEIYNDAITAFESYHHYLLIDEINHASSIIINERKNRWDNREDLGLYIGESLGYSFIRLGLLQSITLASQAVLPKTTDKLILAKLYNLLGDLFWLIGKPHIAIQNHEEASSIALSLYNEHRNSSIKRIYCASLMNRGLCYLSLWDINKAHDLFLAFDDSYTQLSSEIENIQSLLFCAKFCLSLTYSLIDNPKDTLLYIETYKYIIDNPDFYDSWSKGYSMIFLAQSYKNIGFLNESRNKYQEAIKYSDHSNYSQVKAMALYGIGEIERINQEYPSALRYIQSAISILQKIQATPDLSEAYFQIGLTYQAMEENDQAEEYKAKALELFAQMEAPKQIERVNKAFEQGARK